MKRYSINLIEIVDWTIIPDEIRMLCYNFYATRISGHKINLEWEPGTDSEEKIISEIIDFELKRNRNCLYWNNVFSHLLEVNNIPIYNEVINNTEAKCRWEIEILESIYLFFDLADSTIMLKKDSETLFIKDWTEFNGKDFYALIKKINFRF